MSFQFRNDYYARLCVSIYMPPGLIEVLVFLICGAELATEGCPIQGQRLIIDMYEDR